ncbi:hypothetical protein K2X85_16860 [bacterium]|nr:hypothetical protein [bacterium]
MANDNRRNVSPDPQLSAEPDAHVKARHLKTVVQALLVAFLVGTIVALLFFRPVAYLCAIPIPVLYIVLVLVNSYERSARASHLRRSGQTHLGAREIKLDEEVAGVATALKIAGAIALAAIIIAASLFEWKFVGIAAAGVFFYVSFMMLPYWPLFVSESRREEHEKVTGESEEEG